VSTELERAIRAWDSTYDGLAEGAIDVRVRGFTILVDAIADGRSVSPDAFAAALQLPVEAAAAAFAGRAASGMQFDAKGDLVGAALTPRPTPHRFNVRGRELFAWCSLDTLFLPGLLEETASVESSCPESGEAIRLELAPDAILDRQPEDIGVTVVLPGEGASSLQTGPASPT
jgi:alkylmercury lyase